MAEVRLHPEAEAELLALPVGERVALRHAMEKLEAMGVALGYPHTSNLHAARALRELRPRAGASRWRALYRQIDDAFVIGAIVPVGSADPSGFSRATVLAEERLDSITT